VNARRHVAHPPIERETSTVAGDGCPRARYVAVESASVSARGAVSVSVVIGPAAAAFERLLARFGAALRLAGAVAGAVGALVGLAPPARPVVVGLAVSLSLGWAVAYALLAWRRGWIGWLVLGDIAAVSLLCLSYRWLVPAAVPARSPTWIVVLVSCGVVVSQFGRRPALGFLAIAVVPAAYAAGAALADRPAPNLAAVMAAQGVGTVLVLRLLRRKAGAADQALAGQEALRRDEAVRTARRAEEREQCRLLHDSVSATLTVIAGGGATGSPTLRAQSCRDLAVVELLQAPTVPPEPGADQVALREHLTPVLARPGLAVEARIEDVAVPAAVAAAIAGAVTETLTNAARHAAVDRMCLRACTEDGGVRVELTDEGRGFDPAGVPARRRGLRESVATRMALVGGLATVTSQPGSGTRTVLRWPASIPAAGHADPPPEADTTLGGLVTDRYQRGLELAIVCLLGVRHLITGAIGILGHSAAYHSATLDLLAWVAMAVVWAVASRRLLRRQDGAVGSWALAAVVLLASVLVTAEVRPGYELTGADWVLSIAGWFLVLILLRRPFRDLALALAANLGCTVALLVGHGAAGRVTVVGFLMLAYAVAALQVGVTLVFRALDGTAQRAAAAAAAESAIRRRGQVAHALHRSRLERYETVRRSVVPLLSGLASGELDPADRAAQRACEVEANRLRRLFAESDDVPDPLLHELRACADLAHARGVLVDLQVVGRLPELPRSVRRALTEGPLHALAAADREARVTVLGRCDEVAVSVLVDTAAGDQMELAAQLDRAVTVTVQGSGPKSWIEARWRPGPAGVTGVPAARQGSPEQPGSRTRWDPQAVPLP
jgi:signal transduction histidine kinase